MQAVEGLPPVRVSAEDAKHDLDTFGLALFHGAMTSDELTGARRRLDEQAAAEEARGLAWHDGGEAGGPPGPNQRVYNLVNKGEIFRSLAMKPIVHEFFRHMLGSEFILSSFTANIAKEGGAPMFLHTDQSFAPPETPHALVANCLWMLDDFTEENGATRVVPRSHASGRLPPANEAVKTVPVVGVAGTVLVFDGRLWHGTGSNRTDSPRRAILTYVCRPFVRQQENATVSTAPEVLETCAPELQAFLGFKVWNSLGGVNGSRSGILNERPKTFAAELES